MTPADAPPTPLRSQPSVRGYTILCLTALMAMVLALMENDRELVGILLVAGLGAVGVVAYWRSGTVLVLLGLAVLEVFHRATSPWYSRMPGYDDSPFMDAVLCAAVLTYATGNYRLLSLTHTIFPVDYRRPTPRREPAAGRRPKPFDGRQRRSPGLPSPWETPLLALTAAGWAVAVSLLWLVLSEQEAPAGMDRGLWRGLLLIFLVTLTMGALWGAAAYLDWARATPEEHLLFLQDDMWRATRREQNRINRFIVWARLRGQRRREKP